MADNAQGRRLRQASFGRPIDHSTADRLLDELLQRTREYNADPTRLCAVVELRLFGSYLDLTQSQIGDLDINVIIANRKNSTYWEDSERQAMEAGRQTGVIDHLFYPVRNLLTTLKKCSTGISLTVEDIAKITENWRTAYRISDDPNAIQLTDDAKITDW